MENFWIKRSRIGQNGCETTRENRENRAGRKGRKTCVRHVFVKSIVRSRQKGQGNAVIISGIKGLSTYSVGFR